MLASKGICRIVKVEPFTCVIAVNNFLTVKIKLQVYAARIISQVDRPIISVLLSKCEVRAARKAKLAPSAVICLNKATFGVVGFFHTITIYTLLVWFAGLGMSDVACAATLPRTIESVAMLATLVR